MKCEPASKLSLVSGNYHEPAEPVVMVMASIDVKIRHVFADTPITEASIGSAPPGNNIAQWWIQTQSNTTNKSFKYLMSSFLINGEKS